MGLNTPDQWAAYNDLHKKVQDVQHSLRMFHGCLKGVLKSHKKKENEIEVLHQDRTAKLARIKVLEKDVKNKEQ